MEYLFDRKEILEILDKRIKGLKEGFRQNIAIIGDELLGKTSLIRSFLSNFKDESILPIYLEVKPESFLNFTKRFLGVVLYNLLKSSNLELKDDLENLLEESNKLFPKTSLKVKEILEILDKKRNLEIFLSLLSLPKIIKEETNKFSLIIFDEFSYLEEFDIKRIFSEWAKIIMLEKDTMYVLISSEKFRAKNILSSEFSLLFGNFEVIEILPLDQNSSFKFIKEIIGSPLKLDYRIREYLINFTGGVPFYLKLICRLIKELESQNIESISLDLFIEIIANLLFDQEGVLNQRFLGILRLLNQESLSLLTSIASGYNRIKDISSDLHLRKKDVVLKLNRLQEKNLIQRSGDFFSISDRVFNFWIKFVYLLKTRSLKLDENLIRDEFKRKVFSSIEEFININKKERIIQIMELFSLFSDDKILIEKKRTKLDRFREIKSLRFYSREEGILGRSKDNLWIAMLKEDLVTEEDVSEFIRECKKYRSEKLQRRLIIAFSDIDINARLLSKAQRIQTWDTQVLNLLSDIYNRPRIVISK